MDELVNQLRKLGEATQAHVDPVTANEVALRTPAPVNDIGVTHRAPQGRTATLSGARPQRRLSPKVFAAAATLVLLVGATVVFSRDNDSVDLASAIQPRDFVVPTNDNGWEELRQCESSGDYSAATGNSFYGAYQFTRGDFREMAQELDLTNYLGAVPAEAPSEIQDVIANALYLRDGPAAWPICGHHIRGPMVTPVVPEWTSYATTVPETVLVFINTAVDDARMAEITDEVELILAPNSSSPDAVRFVDHAQAYQEYRGSFDGQDEELLPIGPNDVPARFEIGFGLSEEDQQRLRDIAGVYQIIGTGSHFGSQQTLPMRLSIPALGLSTPVYPSSSIDLLARGPVVLVDTPAGLVIGGHGSIEDSVFGQLDQLRDGDEIIVTSLVNPGGSAEFVRRFVVDVGDGAPPVYDVGDMLLWRRDFQSQTLTLVADAPGDASARIVVRTKASGPDLRSYPADSE